ncbi:hypothetical protein [Roseivirga sp. UBA838]|uniref:hypothetical protein n=1 Tax=Roseivirga sp. UBA838 TaxID=1947393 RepID=UPI00257EE8B2|nr:hypothetical protein [Roseivirga sp. UBA838]|tara:strand:+ start:2176 stop:2463 length:288 start_codon:yes stop_codon:yes gene_type:complete
MKDIRGLTNNPPLNYGLRVMDIDKRVSAFLPVGSIEHRILVADICSRIGYLDSFYQDVAECQVKEYFKEKSRSELKKELSGKFLAGIRDVKIKNF